jgi:predicted transcriptional regulator
VSVLEITKRRVTTAADTMASDGADAEPLSRFATPELLREVLTAEDFRLLKMFTVTGRVSI